MTASKILFVAACSIIVLAQIVSTGNIVLECISLFYCNGDVPVCGTNGTHCWHSKSDCERAKFNCLQFSKKDFEKTDLNYCGELTLGGIKECCAPQKCPNKNEQICAQSSARSSRKCRWFKNNCELKNHNCGNEKGAMGMFTEVNKALCKFEFGDSEQECTEAVPLKNDTLTSNH